MITLTTGRASQPAATASRILDYAMGLSMGALLMIGAFIGAHSAIRYGTPFIRPVFLLVVVAMAGRLLIAG